MDDDEAEHLEQSSPWEPKMKDDDEVEFIYD